MLIGSVVTLYQHQLPVSPCFSCQESTQSSQSTATKNSAHCTTLHSVEFTHQCLTLDTSYYYTANCTLHTAYCTLHTRLQCGVLTALSYTHYIAHFRLSPTHCALHTAHCASTLHTENYPHYTLYCTLHILHCTLQTSHYPQHCHKLHIILQLQSAH